MKYDFFQVQEILFNFEGNVNSTGKRYKMEKFNFHLPFGAG